MIKTVDEMLTKYDLKKDLSKMEDYLETTHPDLPKNRMPFADYLRFWEQAKNGGLFKLFGNKLQISKKVSYNQSARELKNSIDKSYFYNLSRNINCHISRIVQIISTRYMIGDWVGKLYRHYPNGNLFSIPRYQLLELFEQDSPMYNFVHQVALLADQIPDLDVWLDNSCFFNNRTVLLPGSSKKFILQNGIKPVRAIKNFCNFMSLYRTEVDNLTPQDRNEIADRIEMIYGSLEELRQEISMFLNQRKFVGNLVISIHPFDYMTMSEPENGWSSCMRWDDGEYHAGTLEMMTSSSVIVAYLESKETIHPAGISETWNKKKWRELFVVDPQFVCGIKGYPYHNSFLEENVFEMIADLAKKNWNIEFNTKEYPECEGESFEEMSLYTELMYNDWENNTTRFMLPVERTELPSQYYYGEGAYCLVCGCLRTSETDEDEYADRLVCSNCDGAKICPICGERWYSSLEEAPDGMVCCINCLDEYRNCIYCGISHHRSKMNRFRIIVSKDSLCWEQSIYVCEEHVEEVKKFFQTNDFNEITAVNQKGYELIKTYLGELDSRPLSIQAKWLDDSPKPDFLVET